MRGRSLVGMLAAGLLIAACNGGEDDHTNTGAVATGGAGASGGTTSAAGAPVGGMGAGAGGSASSGGPSTPSANAGAAAPAGSGGAAAGSDASDAGTAPPPAGDAATHPGPSDAGADAGSDPGPSTGAFPPISDPWQRGPFAVTTQSGAGPDRNATVFYPRTLGENGLEHPIVVWDNGNTVMGPSIYQPLLEHLASHGFAVYAAYIASDQGTEIKAGLDWMIAENERDGSAFYHKLDVTKTAAMGHSQGSIATFAIAGDARLTTTIHLSGGTNPDIAQGHETLANLHHPAAFICGEPGGDGLIVGDVASEWCAYDFEHAMVPVFLAQITGASHISAPSMTQGACAAWLRWQLTGDTTMRPMFAGDDCALCKRPNWVVQQRGL